MQPTDAPDSVRLSRVLMRLTGVVVLLEGGGRIGPIDWTLERGRRTGVRCASDAQWHALVGVLSGVLVPTQGLLQEFRRVRVQTDVRLRENLNLNQSLGDYLHSPGVPDTVWLDGRRRSVGVLVDALGISPAMTRRALKFSSPAVQHKCWVLRFLLSQADLVLARDIFNSEDPEVQSVFRRRWADLPDALVAGEGRHPLPGPIDSWAAIDEQGRFTSGITSEAAGRPMPAEPAGAQD